MKIVVSLCAALLILALPSFGQGTWAVGVGGGGGVPIGDFSNASNFGIGGHAWVAYNADPNFAVTFKSGYLRFSGKEYKIVVQGVTATAKTNYGVIPILVGGRYYFMPSGDTRVYGAADVGMYSLNASADVTATGGGVSISGSTSTTETKFGASPSLGVLIKAGEKMNVDINGNFTYVATDIKSTTWIGFAIGLEFGL